MIDEIETMLEEHFRKVEASIDRHERRLAELDAARARRNAAFLLNSQLELDAVRGD